jgi:hypothetical protein
MTPDLEDRTSNAARQLIKSQMRTFIFAERLRETHDESKWGPMLTLEETYKTSAEEEWRAIVTDWAFGDEKVQDRFSKIIADALNNAAAETIEILATPEDVQTMNRLVRQYISDFSVDTLFRASSSASIKVN